MLMHVLAAPVIKVLICELKPLLPWNQLLASCCASEASVIYTFQRDKVCRQRDQNAAIWKDLGGIEEHL